MIRSFLFVAAALILVNKSIGQSADSLILSEPGNWEFERFALPPGFAPAITYKGYEELRFAPGMYKTDAEDYFSYAFVANLEEIKDPTETDLLNYLLSYYKGLCGLVARDRKLTIDTSSIKVAIKKNGTDVTATGIYEAVVNLFGVFTNGAPVTLNLDIQVIQNAARKRTYIIFLASPQSRTANIWQQLYDIRKKLRLRISS